MGIDPAVCVQPGPRIRRRHRVADSGLAWPVGRAPQCRPELRCITRRALRRFRRAGARADRMLQRLPPGGPPPRPARRHDDARLGDAHRAAVDERQPAESGGLAGRPLRGVRVTGERPDTREREQPRELLRLPAGSVGRPDDPDLSARVGERRRRAQAQDLRGRAVRRLPGKLGCVVVRSVLVERRDPRARSLRRRRPDRALAVDLRGRPLRRVRRILRRNRRRRHEWDERRLRLRPHRSVDAARIAGYGRRAGRQVELRALDLQRRPFRRFRVDRDELRA